MSERVLRPSADAGISKRGRKARPSFTDDDKQRERKRAMDRKAQRVSREKTRSHIAHLEKMVEILCEKNESEATTDLMAEVSRLNHEIDRLRKIIETIKSVLRADSFEIENQEQNHSASNGSRGGSRSRGTQIEDMDLTSNIDPVSTPKAHSVIDDPVLEDEQPSPSNTSTAIATTRQEEPDESTLQTRLDCSSKTPLNFSNSWDAPMVSTHRRTRASPDPSQLWAKLYPSISAPHIPKTPATAQCRIWQKCNRIYAKMFNIKLSHQESADQISTGAIIKAVKDGWSSLSAQELDNPVMQVMRDVDQQIFPTLDRVTRIALMHKSHLLMKFFLHSEQKNWGQMPLWQRPVPSQSTTQHPIAIDFFAWPALRDRLVEQHTQYFSTPHFSEAYQRHFKFSWPFTFDSTYIYDADTDTYQLSPLFERYHRELKYWGMEEAFFQRFPELFHDMPVAHAYESADGSERTSVSPADSGSPEAGAGHVRPGFEFAEVGTQGYDSTDAYMTELFNNLPCI